MMVLGTSTIPIVSGELTVVRVSLRILVARELVSVLCLVVVSIAYVSRLVWWAG